MNVNSNATYAGMQTNVQSNLKIHELNHSGERNFKCGTCSYATNHKGNLKNTS